MENNVNDVDESIFIEEDGKPLNELSKKEKNLFLRELIQPGLAKVMFFDGEKLLSLYDEGNLTAFIAESCRYLFGLNFVDLLNTDLNYYINKLYSQQDASQSLTEIKKVRDELNKINTEIIALEDEKAEITTELIELKNSASQAERQISDQGRWAANTLDRLKQEKQQLETSIIGLKKELVELYSALGPFVFCKNLIRSLKERLMIERDIDKWQHARDLLKQKIGELEVSFNDLKFLNELSLNHENGKKLFPVLKEILLSTPKLFSDGEKIHHEMADNERSKLISWIDETLNSVSGDIQKKSEAISLYEERLKVLSKEQSSFSKDDVIVPLLREIQEVNKKIGADEQKLSSLNRKADEANKRREFYTTRLASLEQKLQQDSNVDEKLKLSSRTKLVLEAYAQQLLTKKLHLLREKVLHKFNLLCRKDSYLDNLIIDPQSFEIRLGRNETIVEHAHLSAGEKQLLIISFLWGLRELTNIALPLIIDTPLARLDLERHHHAIVVLTNHGILPIVQIEDENEELDQPIVSLVELKKLALRNNEYSYCAFFDGAMAMPDLDLTYKLTDSTKYKAGLAAVNLAKQGTDTDIQHLIAWISQQDLDKRWQYIGMRSLLFLMRRHQLMIPKTLLLSTYRGRYWHSVLQDLVITSCEDIQANEIFDLIEKNSKDAPYVDYLVALLSKVMKQKDRETILQFITERVKLQSGEKLFDKYFYLALELEADFDYFMELMRLSINSLDIKYTTLLHQRIADLAESRHFYEIEQFIRNLLKNQSVADFHVMLQEEVLHFENRYLYTWVMGCAFCRLADRDYLPMMIALLQHSFYTLRKAAFDWIVVMGKEEDLVYFLNADRYEPKRHEFKLAFFLLDCKTYLMDKFDQIWADNYLEVIYHPTMIKEFLPKTGGKLADPEKVREPVSYSLLVRSDQIDNELAF